jgi:peptidoglycan/xylan/chitin deacetylase (PgdA/CDA1 family)
MCPTKAESVSFCSKPRVIVTTSWDDEHTSNLRLAELLRSVNLPATFYVPTASLGIGQAMTGGDLCDLAAQGFEIGAHTVTHPVLTEISVEQMRSEVTDCKIRLEEILGREVVSFCYPKGKYNNEVVQALRNAGYRGARTVRMLFSGLPRHAFEIPTSLQSYPHEATTYVRNLVKRRAFGDLAKMSREIARGEDWVQLGKALFDRVLERGGSWHIFGHSWEIDRENRWDAVRELLSYVSNRSGVDYVTNAELAEMIRSQYRQEQELAAAQQA